jgi:3-(3-hydroxy-phenyl)propionate hydroxylase
MTDHYSVAVVGAGPTGLTLANLLGKAGVRTLLIEANPATVGEPRAVSIDDESLRVVQQMGLLEPVLSEIVSGYGSEYLGPDRTRFLKVKPSTQPYGHPRRNAFRQPILENQLRAGLTRFNNVVTLFECKAESFEERADGVHLHLQHADGGRADILADYLIGCDGARSPTREMLGYGLSGTSLSEKWLIIDLEDSPSTSPETTVYCDPKRPGIMLPGPRDTRRYEFKLMPGETEATLLADDMIAHLLETHDGVPGARVVRKTVYYFHARIANHWGRGRIWLAGDAAHLMPPFAGQGMNGGIRDAANIAWKLVQVISGKIGPKLLESYERERRTHIGQMIRLALRMGAIFGPRTSLHGLAIRSAFRALGIWPAARTYFAEMKYKPVPRFDHGFFLEGQLSRRGIVGRMLAQPQIPSLAGERLDTLLGDGFSLVGIDVAKATVDSLSLGDRWDTLIDHRVALDGTDVPAFQRYRGKMLLVRPDRYVMAEFSSAGVDGIREQLDQLLAESWMSSGSAAPRVSRDSAEPASTAATSIAS